MIAEDPDRQVTNGVTGPNKFGLTAFLTVAALLAGCASGHAYGTDTAGFKVVPDEAMRQLLVGSTMSPDPGDQQILISGGGERFEPNGIYFRLSDLASIPGSYTITSNRFCVRPTTTKVRECRRLLVDESGRYATVAIARGKSREVVRVKILKIQH